ncbi:SIR2 family protein [Empedobacter brevis]|uniref:SIR2 family protein n=1 Tax=Empedobacter brevis TaxID=247 RepID=A0AAJ1QC66_9FLAO|nr:SIR2 family protein [Empedobacter brevis]MDM1071310.1 SIR2 family protein [Empedobacter brevis]
MTEDLLALIQKWINNVPTVILGSGASVPYKIPGMYDLGNYIKQNCEFHEDKDLTTFNAFVEKFDETEDLEASLLEVKVTKNVVDAIVSKTWECINNADLKAYDKIITSEYKLPLKDLLSHLISTSDHKVSVITTNYDRIVEYASSEINAYINNTFTQNYIGKSTTNISRILPANLYGYSGIVEILKVHGSLDWFKSGEDIKYQFPLRKTIPQGFMPSIVTPGVSKYEETHMEPYRTIFSKADLVIESSKSFFCVGYGFNDSHFQPKLIDQIKNGKPIIVLARTLTEKTKQSIVDNNCKNYFLLERAGDNQTRIYSSKLEEPIIEESNIWSFDEFINYVIK